MLEAFLVSTSVVALAEIGDKTQLLSLVLAARYRKPLPIVLGVLAATLANHAAAGALGTWLSGALSPVVLDWAVVASFLFMAGWILVPDKLDSGDSGMPKEGLGVFAATAIAFFLAEMGDKTQVATIALAARFHDFIAVVAGTTLAMLIANVPVIYLGQRYADRLPARLVHAIACVIFLVLGGLALRQALLATAS
jgi:putative Ca2+/H+ antiporter (TMEM165/GDT1 family)